MKRSLIALAALAGALTFAPSAFGQHGEPGGKAPVGGIVRSGYTKMTATVVSINMQTREATLRGEDGKTFTITVDPKVTNLDQVKPGDVVKTTLTESVAYAIRKPGTAAPGEKTSAAGDSGKAGEKPKGVSRKVKTVTVTVTGLDPKMPSITFKNAKGETETAKLQDPAYLTGVKVGDLVELTYTEALAFSVEKAPAKK